MSSANGDCSERHWHYRITVIISVVEASPLEYLCKGMLILEVGSGYD